MGGGLGSSAGRISTTGHETVEGGKSICVSIGAVQTADTAGDISGVAVTSHWQPLPGSGACSGQQDFGSFGSSGRSCIPHSFPHRSALQVSAPMPVPADAKNTSIASESRTAIDTGRKIANVLILTLGHRESSKRTHCGRFGGRGEVQSGEWESKIKESKIKNPQSPPSTPHTTPRQLRRRSSPAKPRPASPSTPATRRSPISRCSPL